MEFKSIEKTSITIKKKGFWKPLFKFRYRESYFDKTNRIEFEHKLREDLFANNNAKIIITRNAYPFPFDSGIDQYVVWVRDQDPGIDNMRRVIEKLYPGFDYIVSINKPEYRSIKSILHYHLLLRSPLPTTHLKKLIVFHRHGNRYPITKFPRIEKLMGNNDFSDNHEALLLPIGYENAIKFGRDLLEIYQLDNNFLFDIEILTSPATRCNETVYGVMKGLGIKTKINQYLPLRPNLPQVISDMLDCTANSTDYYDLLDRLKDIFQIPNKNQEKCRRLFDFYDIHSSIKCYEDMGIDIDKYLDNATRKELEKVTTETYNIYGYYGQIRLRLFLKKIVDTIKFLPNNLIICSTHDTLVFLLAKYFADLNEITNILELPGYLANVRIEIWSDESIRIFYDNYYLGDKIEKK